MKKFLYTLVLIFFLFTSINSQAQILSKANKYFNSFAYKHAIELYEILWQRDSTDNFLTKQLAVSYRRLNNTEKTEEWYGKLIKSSETEPIDYLYYARALQANGKYQQAKQYLEKYAARSGNQVEGIDLNYISELHKASNRYSIAPIQANSDASDFGTAYYKNKIVFSSAKAKPSIIKRNYGWNKQNYLRLYQASPLKNGDLKSTGLLSHKLETKFHDGPVCFNAEGTEMFVTRNFVSDTKTAKRNKQGIVSIQLYYAQKLGENWSVPKLMEINLDGYSTGHPSLSKDGKRLFFISDRPGGEGGTDIYYSDRMKNGWSKPTNAGKNVNTAENEMFPFIADDNTLFFASKGHRGLGGLDIFWIDDLKTGEPINMGVPINSSKDDFALIVKNGAGYFSSNRVKGESFDDIYRFSILERILKGQVFNDQTHEVIPNAQISLIDSAGNVVSKVRSGENGEFQFEIKDIQNYRLLATKQLFSDGTADLMAISFSDKTEVHKNLYQTPNNSLQLDVLVVYREDRSPVPDTELTIRNNDTNETMDLFTDSEGKLTCSLQRNTEYTLEFNKDGVLSKSNQISTFTISGDKMYVEEVVDKVQIGKVFVLENIFYDLNKANIRPDAAVELDKLVAIMNDNPSLKIELSSHTDSRGSDAYNMALSERRAKAAADYIISNGISKERIVAKGYGETKLINRCSNGVKCSKAEHQANRRTEVKVLDL